MTAMLEVKVMTAEVMAMLQRVEDALQPRTMALRFTQKLLEDFREQINNAFDNEGPSWPALSEMRVEARGGSRSPILQWGGSFRDEVSRYKGTITIRQGSFDYDFPGDRETSGRYWGLTAGQLVNPLGLTPLSHFPRPILAGNAAQERASIIALIDYFEGQGWEVEVS